MKTGRNDPCHCGSGQKYKKCCATKDDATRTAEAAAQAVARAAAAAESAEEASPSANTSGGAKDAGARASSASGAVKAPKGPQPRGPSLVRKHAV